MTVHTLPLGNFQTNCYILEEADTCLLIDPGFAPARILSFLDEKGWKPTAILLTHGHFDHVGAVDALVAATGCALYMHRADHSQSPLSKTLYPLAGKLSPHFIAEGDTLPMGLTVLETPGHTPGSVCYLGDGVLFSGDTLFCRSCGRTDLPGSNAEVLRKSLRRLAALPEALTVYPGHGESTTIAAEKRYNPYL